MNQKKRMNKKEQKAISVKIMNSKIKYVKLKDGINRTKDDYEEIRWNKYCRKTNSINTKGRKKYKNSYPTTSKMEWDKKELERKGIETSEKKFIESLSNGGSAEKIEIPAEETAVIIWFGGKVADVYKTKINLFKKDPQKIKIGLPGCKKKVEIEVEKADLYSLPEKIEVGEIEIETRELIKLVMKNDIGIYKYLGR